MGKRWSHEDKEYLENSWGEVNIKKISKKLGRSKCGIINQANDMKLGRTVFMLNGITLNQLAQAFNTGYSATVKKLWVEKYNLPVKYKVTCEKKRYSCVKLKDFWKWAEQNKHILNFSKLEPNALGQEPNWVKEKRAADFNDYRKQSSKRPWTKADDKKLVDMINLYRYTYKDLSDYFNRTERAIKNRLVALDIPGRPINRNGYVEWTKERVELIVEMTLKGYPLNIIADKIGNGIGEISIRDKLERVGYNFKTNKFADPDILLNIDYYVGRIKNIYINCSDYFILKILGSKYEAEIMIDAEDVERVREHTWFIAKPDNYKSFRFVTKITSGTKTEYLFLDQYILSVRATRHSAVVCVNENIYDLRKANLRLVPAFIRTWMHDKDENRGLCFEEKRNSWTAHIEVCHTRRTKSFGVAKYGFDEAKRLAKECRKNWENEYILYFTKGA